MRVFLYSLVLFFCCAASVEAASSQLISKEVKFKESAAEFYQDAIASLSFPIEFSSEVEFNHLADSQGFGGEELERQLQWLARVYLEPGIGVDNAMDKAQRLMTLLEIIADTPYDKAYLLMLAGRKVGREKQDYQQAITHYQQALAQLKSSEDLATQLLLHSIHYQLGDVYRITLQKNAALTHLNQYRELAYQLRDDYLIAKAEATLGRYYSGYEQFAKALQHYTEAIRLAEGLDKPFLNAILSLRLARVYRDLKSWDEALTYAHKAADGFTKVGKDNYLSSAMTVIAMVYGEQERWNQAIDYYLNAQQIDVRRGNLTAQALNLHNLGEAYFNNKEPKRALSNLIKANGLFLQKKSKHYLIYNDLLIAEVASQLEDWSMVNAYAAKAFVLAREKKLPEQMFEALQYKTRALKELGDIDKALVALDQLITLSQELEHESLKPSDYSPSVLAEQQLKLMLNQLQASYKELEKQAHQFRLAASIIFIICLLLGLVGLNQWRGKSKLKQKFARLKHKVNQEAITQLPGYHGFITRMNQSNAFNQLALLSLDEGHKLDLTLGTEVYLETTSQLMNSLSSTLKAETFIIRPGLILIGVREVAAHQALLDQIRILLDKQPQTQGLHFKLGCIKVPLLGNPEIKVTADTYFNVLQMLAAGAMSLGPQNDSYVSITPLNFAPAAILSNPLYLHLEKGISRGLVKVECNEHKSLIQWPKWQGTNDADPT
ncbi:tetratricopeptide repeat protein [Shewanella sp. Isolate7]|uniref:tetratricopeptide repeat protein n=1 Tax=Shewanella sp. Isolate7 TaxID=2908528 RepID=UPI001EFCF050|nr:tetratricopeptide repeat protein [Shewanella sp. Isolate7]MCG9722464.1 tetratricopeptide repeat protein [Shewanella sp. Isolate7]